MKMIKKTVRPIFARTLLVTGGVLLVWRISAFGISQYYLGQAGQNARHLDFSLAWNSKDPAALSLSGQLLAEDDLDQAESLLRRAFNANPSDSHALIALARIWFRRGDVERADQAVAMAGRLSPADIAANLQAAAYWLLRGDAEHAIRDWNRTLRAQRSFSKQLFPILLLIAEQPAQGQSGFAKIVKQLPPWWEDFFIYATRKAKHVNTLRALYVLYQKANHRPNIKEINAYITRLQSEGLWSEAYLVWLNSLTSKKLSVLGQVYDGGFEQTRFEQGFDWHIPSQKGIEVDAHSLFGGRRGRALQLTFHGDPVPGIIAEQALFLLPGHYRLSGLVKADSIETANGLVWTISCADGEKTTLAHSERFVGSNQWRSFSTPFSVPAEHCTGQRLYLHVKGTLPRDFRVSGEAWFDNLAVTWIPAKTDAGSVPSR